MVFSSAAFLFLFMPIALAGYFLCTTIKAKNEWLLAASLLFYAWGEPVYVVLMIVSIALNWSVALAIDHRQTPGQRRALLACLVAADVAIIGFFKYQGFLAHTVNAIAGAPIMADLQLPLPIGISFYTLQALSYAVDVYRGKVRAQHDIVVLGMYIACFPQLIAGPIIRYADISEQIANRRASMDGFADGMRLFIVGLAKKVLLANVVAMLATDMLSRGGPAVGAVGAWAGLLAYTFQIYFDFGGYSDMAIGLGRMLGFTYKRNFNYPYISTSAREFWRRWHISLSGFFRDYVYIPLGGNRVSTPRWVVNMLVVWSITGLWHGAAWNFVLWGAYWGALLVGERLLWGDIVDQLPRIIGHLYAIVAFLFGWSVFWIEDPVTLLGFWQAMVGGFGATGTSTMWELGVWEYAPVFIVCCIASTPLVPWLRLRLLRWAVADDCPSEQPLWDMRKLESDELCRLDIPAQCPPSRARALAIVGVVADIALLALLAISAAAVVWGSFNPFIYFRF